MLILPSFIVAGIVDGPPPPPSSVLLGIGATFGVPLIATGAMLTLNRYRIALYLATFTGVVHVAAPLVVFRSLFVPLYIPAAIVFLTIVVPGWVYVAIVRFTQI